MTEIKDNSTDNLKSQVEEALDTIRPYLKADGGNIEIVDITEDMVLKVRLLGNCESCPMSFMTMKAGVEEAIKKHVPEILSLETVE